MTNLKTNINTKNYTITKNYVIVKTKINTNGITLCIRNDFINLMNEKYNYTDIDVIIEHFFNKYIDDVKRRIKELYKNKELNNFVCEIFYSGFCVCNVKNLKNYIDFINSY